MPGLRQGCNYARAVVVRVYFLISGYYFDEFLKNIDLEKNIDDIDENIINNKKTSKGIDILKTEIIDKIDKNTKKASTNKKPKIDNYKYLQKNIIDVNSYNKYIFYLRKSFKRCPFCKEYTIYKKIEGNYDRCLKCLKKFCKFCHKEFNAAHLDISSNDHCKVYYRNNKEYKQQKFFIKIAYNYIYVIVAYLFILTFFLIKLKRGLKIHNTFFKLIAIVVYFFLFFIFIPLNLIILPFFPIIISL